MAGRLRTKIRTRLEGRDATKERQRTERLAKEASGRDGAAPHRRQPPGESGGGGAGAT
jgi:hypothetical protein